MKKFPKNNIKHFQDFPRQESKIQLPGTIGPICSERTIGPRAQSLRMGSQETEMKKPISSTESICDEEVAPLISLWVPCELVCNNNFYIF